MSETKEKETNDVIQIESVVKDVTVYRNGVKVTRKGSISLEKGSWQLIVAMLPLRLDPWTVKVKGTGPGRITSISVEEKVEKKASKEEIRQLQAAIEKHDREIELLNELIAFHSSHAESINAARQAFLESTPFTLPPGDPVGHLSSNDVTVSTLPPSGIAPVLDAMGSMLIDASEKCQAHEERIRLVEKELDELEKKLAQQSSGQTTRYNTLTVNVQASKGDYAFTIEYVVQGGGWSPVHDVLLGEDDGVTLKLMAALNNQSGEDWTDVALQLSTADLRPVAMIEPSPWILREYKPQPVAHPAPRAMLEAPGGARRDEKAKRMETRPAAPPPEAKLELVQAKAGGSPLSAQTFTLPARYSIPDGKFKHFIFIYQQELESKMEYFWSSASSKLIARNLITNGALQLLPGPCKLHAGGDYIGETWLDAVLPREEFVLGTRESHDLKVTKKMEARSTDKGGAIKNKVEREYEYSITVKKLAAKDRKLVIMDRIPHSNSELVKIDMVRVEPVPSEQRLGVLQWEIDLGKRPEDEFKITYKYTVSHDKDVVVTTPLP